MCQMSMPRSFTSVGTCEIRSFNSTAFPVQYNSVTRHTTTYQDLAIGVSEAQRISCCALSGSTVPLQSWSIVKPTNSQPNQEGKPTFTPTRKLLPSHYILYLSSTRRVHGLCTSHLATSGKKSKPAHFTTSPRWVPLQAGKLRSDFPCKIRTGSEICFRLSSVVSPIHSAFTLIPWRHQDTPRYSIGVCQTILSFKRVCSKRCRLCSYHLVSPSFSRPHIMWVIPSKESNKVETGWRPHLTRLRLDLDST